MAFDGLRTKVLSVHQSPLNVDRWCLVLACGHDIWVTAKHRPRCKTAKCMKLHMVRTWLPSNTT